MKTKSGKGSVKTKNGSEIPPVTRDAMHRGEMGKYYSDVMARSNVVRIAPDLNDAFPNEMAVNRALRELLRFRTAIGDITQAPGKKKKSA
jgi:hypothetical protein